MISKKKKFNQQKFDNMVLKAFTYLNKNVETNEERSNCINQNKIISSIISEHDLKMEAENLKNQKANVCCSEDPLLVHLKYDVDKLPDGRNNWTTENAYHLISIWMLARDPQTGRYDPSVKRKVAYKYGFYEDRITNSVNKLINETLKTDKYNLLSKGYFTREQLIRFKYRDKQVRNNCIKNNRLTQEELDAIDKAFNL